MDSREQFEQWAKIVGPEPDLTRANSGLNYADSAIDIAWLAWKASRAAIEIDESDFDTFSPYDNGEKAVWIEEVTKTLSRHGITVKGE